MLELLVFVGLLLVIIPALLLGFGKLIALYTTRLPSWIGFPVRSTDRRPEKNGPSDDTPSV